MENDKLFQAERQNLMVFIWKKRKVLALISISAAVLSLVVSFLMTPLFRSTAIVFPAATSTVSFSEQRNAKASSMDFGEDEHAEQLVQILHSSRIRDIIVERFDLFKHYEIDRNHPNKNFKLSKTYNEHITFNRTRYGSIAIDVLDRDPELAAQIANKIVELIDTVKNEMIKERTIPAYEVNKRKKETLERDLQKINDSLDVLSKNGVLAVEGRSSLVEAYTQAKSPQDKAYLKEKLDVNSEFGATYDGLAMLRNEKITSLAHLEESYEQAESDAYANFNHKFVVEKAIVADKKDKPKKAIIILVATITTLIFSIFLLLILERIKELKALTA
jgi:tyrosine-protein kinase Etk/Wzc